MIEKLWKELKKYSKNNNKKLRVLKPPFKLVETPEIAIGSAWRSKSDIVPLKESLGKISGDIICPYPPGIPILIPGERIDQNRLNWIKAQSLYNEYLINSYIRVLNTK